VAVIHRVQRINRRNRNIHSQHHSMDMLNTKPSWAYAVVS